MPDQPQSITEHREKEHRFRRFSYYCFIVVMLAIFFLRDCSGTKTGKKGAPAPADTDGKRTARHTGLQVASQSGYPASDAHAAARGVSNGAAAGMLPGTGPELTAAATDGMHVQDSASLAQTPTRTANMQQDSNNGSGVSRPTSAQTSVIPDKSMFPSDKHADPGYKINGLLNLTLNSSKGVFSDRSFTAFDTTLTLLASKGNDEFSFNGRWRYADPDLAQNIPAYYITEAWYRRSLPSSSLPSRGYALTAGRQYLVEAAGEQLDGFNLDARLNERVSTGAFLGFRPDPFTSVFRGDALTTGIHSSWRGRDGKSYSREGLVYNTLRGHPDRAFLAWEAGSWLSGSTSLRNYLITDLNLNNSGLVITNYTLQAVWQAVRDLRIAWDGKVYRNIFYYASSAGIPTDRSPIYSTSLNLDYVFTRDLISRTSVSYNHRDSDHKNATFYSESVDLSNVLKSGTSLNFTYAASQYYNAYFDSFSVTLARQFLERLLLNLTARYQKNVAETFGNKNTSDFASASLGGNYAINDKYDLSGYLEYQQGHLFNGPTVGFGFIRDPLVVGTPTDATGFNSLISLTRRF